MEIFNQKEPINLLNLFIEMDAETNKVRWISVYIPELDLENFEDCKW